LIRLEFAERWRANIEGGFDALRMFHDRWRFGRLLVVRRHGGAAAGNAVESRR